jgi:hypothetical protein
MIVQPFANATVELLKKLLENRPQGSADVDILDSIIVAMDLFIQGAPKSAQKRIFLVCLKVFGVDDVCLFVCV